jgi:DNA-binding transcriptional ArsR family regulator
LSERQISVALPTDSEDEVFDALAHRTRRHILALLSRSGGELPSGYLAKRFSHSWPTTSRHLNVLEAAALVLVHRAGRSSKYRLNRARLVKTVGGWLDKLDAPTPDQRWKSDGPKHTKGLRQ